MTDARRKEIPVVFRNGAKYDWRLIEEQLGNIIKQRLKLPEIQSNDDKKEKLLSTKPLAFSSKNFLTYEWNNMGFINSFKFVGMSLDKIVQNLTKEDF